MVLRSDVLIGWRYLAISRAKQEAEFLAHARKDLVFWLSPLIPWMSCVLTVGSAIFLHRKLEAATEVAAQRQSESATEMAVALAPEAEI